LRTRNFGVHSQSYAYAYEEEPMPNRPVSAIPNPADPPRPEPLASRPPPRARKVPTLGMPRDAVTPEARRGLIAENAYLRAERRGFAPGHETEDWLLAEAEVDALLKGGQAGSPQ
jgi:Protein of unknown function (DUF2934)